MKLSNHNLCKIKIDILFKRFPRFLLRFLIIQIFGKKYKHNMVKVLLYVENEEENGELYLRKTFYLFILYLICQSNSKLNT